MNQVLNQLFSVSFFEKAVAFSLPDTLLTLLTAGLLGLFIAALYKATYQGVMYTMTYGVTLVAITMISAMILCVVTSNVVLTSPWTLCSCSGRWRRASRRAPAWRAWPWRARC